MKTHMLIVSLMLILMSCGKGSSSRAAGTNQADPIMTNQPLSIQENLLKDELIKRSPLTQQELVSSLLKSKSLNKAILKKLDRFLIIKCIQASGLCHVDQKE